MKNSVTFVEPESLFVFSQRSVEAGMNEAQAKERMSYFWRAAAPFYVDITA